MSYQHKTVGVTSFIGAPSIVDLGCIGFVATGSLRKFLFHLVGKWTERSGVQWEKQRSEYRALGYTIAAQMKFG